ncbi:MAG: Zn-ribbon domain-containing OB-fold protein [Thermoprotei archaeon]
MSVDKPLPEVDGINKNFFEGLANNNLLIQRCSDCGSRQFYPKPWCVKCGSLKLEWVEASREGRVYTYTLINRVLGNSKEFEKEVPYVVGSVKLEDGVRVYARLVASNPSNIKIGSRVVLEARRLTDKVGLPYFRVVE